MAFPLCHVALPGSCGVCTEVLGTLYTTLPNPKSLRPASAASPPLPLGLRTAVPNAWTRVPLLAHSSASSYSLSPNVTSLGSEGYHPVKTGPHPLYSLPLTFSTSLHFIIFSYLYFWLPA